MTSEKLKQPTRVSLPRLAWTFLLTGFTAYGFTAMQVLRSTVKKQGWLSDKKLDEGLALVQLFPGPVNFDYCAYLGYQLRGVPGAILSTICFVSPSFLLIVGLSYGYYLTGNPEWIPQVFIGLQAIVVGILVTLILDFGKTALHDIQTIFLAIAAFTGLMLKIDAVWIIAGALVFGTIFLRQKGGQEKSNSTMAAGIIDHPREWIGIGLVIIMILSMLLVIAHLANPLRTLCLSLFKVGSIAFGNGMMILPVLRSEIVERLNLLTPAEFTDGIVLGQITPGPFLITAAFIGYKIQGILGAALATFSIFSPTFAMTLIFTRLYNRIRNLIWIQAALAGVMSAFIGMLSLTTLQIAQESIRTLYALMLALGAFIATKFLKLNVIWVFSGGLVIWLLILALKLP